MSLGSQRCCINNLFINGHTGAQGTIGAYGSIGEKGVTGVTGNTGLTGATGICYKGRQGPQGSIGNQGGSTGDAGPAGPEGDSGSESSINRNFTFTTDSDSDAYYNSSGYTDLTGLAIPPLTTNNVTLQSGLYSINWEIVEGWSDNQNKFYVRLKSGSSYLYPEVFNSTSPCVLYSGNTQINGIGNDIITIPTGIYSIELMQSTNSGTILIPSKTIKFSITFVKIT
jgi:hypothetical protein